MIDLHVHSVYSDGTTTPEQNAALAAAEGLAGLALTDHDTTDGWERAAAACARHGLEFVPGLELSTEQGGASVHVLGYWVDPADPTLVAECARLRDERERRARRVVELLGELGVGLEWAAVEALADGAPIGRPHIAAAMVAAGAVADIEAAFDGYLRDGGPAWVPKHAVDPVAGVDLVREAGGAAVLAHPGLVPGGRQAQTALVERLAAAGLAGLEAAHPAHDEEATAYWEAVAARLDLVATGCSDFHGARKAVRIGERGTSHSAVEELRKRAGGVRW